MRIDIFVARLLATATISIMAVSGTAQVRPTGPSDYLKCDGLPNNMTAGESIGRAISAIAVIGLLAPPPEGADPAARLMGAEGVAACTGLLDGVGRDPESNPRRRISLIIARAIHQIEAGNYEAAVQDTARAREESATAALTDNPHFARTTGRGIALIEAHARLRMGQIDEARRLALEGIAREANTLGAIFGYESFYEFARNRSPEEDIYFSSASRLSSDWYFPRAARLEETLDFAAAARLKEDLIALLQTATPDRRSSFLYASTALTQALAGNWERSSALAEIARTNMEALERSGNAERDRTVVTELLDLQAILREHSEGRAGDARRHFTARSAWPGVSFGQLVEAVRRLREGGSDAELTGPLSFTPDQLWDRRREATLASMIEKDKDNKELWIHLRAAPTVGNYHAVSRTVWQVERSRLVRPSPLADWQLINMPRQGFEYAGIDGMMLHAALLAQHQGHPGFVLILAPRGRSNEFDATVRFGSPSDRGIGEELYIDAASIIAQLEPYIPSPDALRAQEQAERRRR